MKIEIDLGLVPAYAAIEIADKILKLLHTNYSDQYIKVYNLEYQFRMDIKPVFEKCNVKEIKIIPSM